MQYFPLFSQDQLYFIREWVRRASRSENPSPVSIVPARKGGDTSGFDGRKVRFYTEIDGTGVQVVRMQTQRQCLDPRRTQVETTSVEVDELFNYVSSLLPAAVPTTPEVVTDAEEEQAPAEPPTPKVRITPDGYAILTDDTIIKLDDVLSAHTQAVGDRYQVQLRVGGLVLRPEVQHELVEALIEWKSRGIEK